MPPLRSFPFPSLSIGTDIAHIPRIAKLVASQRTLPRFLRKLFTSREERAFHLRFPLGGVESDSASSCEGGERQRREDAAARYLAGRWAAKEAVVKACSWRRLMFDEIQIRKDEGSRRVYGVILDRPEVRRAMRGEGWGREDETIMNEALTGEEGEEDEDIPGQIVKISISHDGEYATAGDLWRGGGEERRFLVDEDGGAQLCLLRLRAQVGGREGGICGRIWITAGLRRQGIGGRLGRSGHVL